MMIMDTTHKKFGSTLTHKTAGRVDFSLLSPTFSISGGSTIWRLSDFVDDGDDDAAGLTGFGFWYHWLLHQLKLQRTTLCIYQGLETSEPSSFSLFFFSIEINDASLEFKTK